MKNYLSSYKSILQVTFCLLLFPAGACKFSQIPSGYAGAAADSLAHKILASVNHQFWDSTGALAWNNNGWEYVWDREHQRVSVAWKDRLVLLDFDGLHAEAYKRGVRLTRPDSAVIIFQAYENWLSESFRLYPFARIFDFGADRRIVEFEDGGMALLVTYYAGAFVSGKAYLWQVAENGLPLSVKSWQQGSRWSATFESWDEWKTLSTGIRIAQKRNRPFFDMKIRDIRAARTVQELFPGQDPFAPLADL